MRRHKSVDRTALGEREDWLGSGRFYGCMEKRNELSYVPAGCRQARRQIDLEPTQDRAMRTVHAGMAVGLVEGGRREEERSIGGGCPCLPRRL